jgi:hypothetical protein
MVLIIPYKRDTIPLLRFTIPVFHHSIIPGWKKENDGVAIPYYQAFLEIPIYLTKEVSHAYAFTKGHRSIDGTVNLFKCFGRREC